MLVVAKEWVKGGGSGGSGSGGTAVDSGVVTFPTLSAELLPNRGVGLNGRPIVWPESTPTGVGGREEQSKRRSGGGGTAADRGAITYPVSAQPLPDRSVGLNGRPIVWPT